jgi:uncharacterized protein (DUF302 family)
MAKFPQRARTRRNRDLASSIRRNTEDCRAQADSFKSAIGLDKAIGLAWLVKVAPGQEADVTPEGLKTIASAHDPAATLDQLTAAIVAKGMTVVARIDHAGAAAKAGLALRPTEVVVFGNPRAGTGLMQAVQTIGIDLPLKALVWLDDAGRTWLSYNEPRWLAQRHGLGAGAEATLTAMSEVLAAIAKDATS